MFWLFDSNNPVSRLLARLFDAICLSVLWAFFSLPVITLGAATTALYHTVYHYFLEEEDYLFRSFWTSFRENFVRSTTLWLAMLAMVGIMAVDVLGLQWLGISDAGLGKLYWILLLLFSAVLLCWFVYLFAYAARLQGSIGEALRISFLIMVAHPGKSAFVFLLAFCGGIILCYFPLFIVLVPALDCWLICQTMEKVFRCHIPSENAENHT